VQTLTRPPDDASPIAAPWDAQTRAMVAQLAERGVFGWRASIRERECGPGLPRCDGIVALPRLAACESP
jgi:hypothetical protein